MKNSLSKLLTPVLSRVDKNPDSLVALIEKSFGSRENLFEADYAKLLAITDNQRAAELITVIAALAARQVTESFKFGKPHTEDEIKEFLAGLYINASVECVTVLPLDSAGRVLAAETISDGTVNFSSVVPRQIIDKLAIYGADRFIMAHNHPGGIAEASDGDVLSTRELAAVLSSCGIKLLSHYVVAGGKSEKIEF